MHQPHIPLNPTLPSHPIAAAQLAHSTDAHQVLIKVRRSTYLLSTISLVSGDNGLFFEGLLCAIGYSTMHTDRGFFSVSFVPRRRDPIGTRFWQALS